MSTIDSGLGWSCDSAYYVDDTNTLIGVDVHGHEFRKTEPGGALAASINVSGGRDCWMLISTVLEYAITDNSSYLDPMHTTTYEGVTWYITAPTSGNDSQPSSFPYANPDSPISASSFDYSAAALAIIEAANVQKTAPELATTRYVKTFVEGVEAETATRVNANKTAIGTLSNLTTTAKTDAVSAINEVNSAKQPKTMSAAITVDGTSQTTVEGAVNAMALKISKIDCNIHRDLGTEITNAQKLAIANGTFEDLPIGAYWILNGTVYRIAHHDYYLGTGDTECTSHHIVVVPDNNMYSAAMNNANTTTGGYSGSKMRTENLSSALSTFETDFGAAHILSHRILITNAVISGQASGWAWTDSKVDLMSENMVYGHTVWGNVGFETGVERGQLMLFNSNPEFINKQRSWCWLRSINSESSFCSVNGDCGANGDVASHSGGVRPCACIYFDDVL